MWARTIEKRFGSITQSRNANIRTGTTGRFDCSNSHASRDKNITFAPCWQNYSHVIRKNVIVCQDKTNLRIDRTDDSLAQLPHPSRRFGCTSRTMINCCKWCECCIRHSFARNGTKEVIVFWYTRSRTSRNFSVPSVFFPFFLFFQKYPNIYVFQ